MKNIFYPTMFMAMALLLSAVLLVPRALASPSTVTFTVDSVLDQIDDDTSDGICHSAANHCTLRAAIMQANHLTAPGVTTIVVPAGTYTLARPASGANGEDNGDLNLTAPLGPNQTIVITGAGAASTIIDANRIDGVIRIAGGRFATINNVTIRNGYRPTSRIPYDGGGILNLGRLTITDCLIEGNEAGGAITLYRQPGNTR